MQFFATVTAQAGTQSINTTIEFQPPQLTLTAGPSEIPIGETVALQHQEAWNSYPVDQHAVAWRVSKVWDPDNSLVFDGTGTAPTGYGSFLTEDSETSLFGYAEAVFRGTAPGKIEFQSDDVNVTLVVSGQTPKANALVTMGKLKPGDLVDIYNSQGGSKIPDDKESTVGAFTVCNKNDTNGDGDSDQFQDKVEKTGKGRDEVDLMRMVIHKQAPVAGKKIKISLLGPTAVHFWEKSTKVKEIPVTREVDVWWFEYDPKDFPNPRDIWLEGRGVSSSVRSIEIKLEYNGASQSVKATAVWAEQTDVRYKNAET